MEFIPQRIEGCFLITLDLHVDQRGFFARIFDSELLAEIGLDTTIAQANLSRSHVAGTLRGIHWQAPPHSEAKLVRCVRGSVFDVCVDLREDSSTYGSWVGADLSAENKAALYLPPGCGHAYQTLEPETEILYWASAPYVPSAELGARWDDPGLQIDWPITSDVVLSEKDSSWPDLVIG